MKEPKMEGTKTVGGLGALSVTGVIAAIVGIALFAMGMDKPHIWQSFHYGFVIWTFFTCGCLAMVILINVTRGTWGYPLIRFFEAGAKLMPLMLLLGIAMLAFKDRIYEWANPEIVSRSVTYQHKTEAYLSDTFFNVRTIVYFLFWIFSAYVLTSLYKKEDETRDEKFFLRRTILAAPIAVFFVFTLTAAATDWVMSLEEFWFSTIFGLLITVGCALSAMAAGTLYLSIVHKRDQYAPMLPMKQWRDMGNLLLTLVILWAYMSFSQFLIIWSGNLPEEIIYFVKRREGAWMTIGTLLIFGHFMLPFFLLLSSRLKRTPWMLGFTVVAILVMRLVDITFQIIPSMGRAFDLTDVGAFLGIGGVWVLLFSLVLSRSAVAPRYSLLPKEAMEHA
jgi:hypothetical protein